MNESATPENVFDAENIRRLIELMDRHEISEIDLRQGETRIRIRRKRSASSLGQPIQFVGAGVPAGATGGAAALATGAEPPVEEDHYVLIKSPMVGTFYSAPDPDADPFVRVGDQVNPDTPVCIIEAMKVFNPISAGVSGRIVAVLVENGEAVEYGRPLFRVDTRG